MGRRELNKRLLLGGCLSISAIAAGTALLLFFAGGMLARGTFFFKISDELLADPPIASDPGITDRIEHGIDLIPLLSSEPTGAGNAAKYYIEVVRSLAARETKGMGRGNSIDGWIVSEDEYDTFLEGVRQAECDFAAETLVLNDTPVRLAPAVDVGDNLNHLLWFRRIGRGVIGRGERHEEDGEYEAALQCYEATVKFGFDVEAGRESLIQVFVGAALQRMGAEKLRALFEGRGETQKARLWGDYLRDLESFVGKVKDKTDRLIRNISLDVESAADRLWILKHDADPLFRREILTGLAGTMMVSRDAVEPELERAAESDPDPYVREAARNALKLGGRFEVAPEKAP